MEVNVDLYFLHQVQSKWKIREQEFIIQDQK